MPKDTRSVNFARIVYRLLTSHRGWRVDDLMSSLNIADRTYREYRRVLQDRLTELHDRDGNSRIMEMPDGDAKYLRLAESSTSHWTDADYLGRVAAVYMARRLLGFVGDTGIGEAMRRLLTDFEQRHKDREFTLQHTLRNVDRMFYEVPFGAKDYSEKGDVLDAIVRGLLYTFWLDITYESTNFDDDIELRLAPYTLVTYASGLYLIARSAKHDSLRYYSVDRIKSAEVTDEKFEYPSTVAYDPADFASGGFGLFRGDEDDEEVDFEVHFADKIWLKRLLKERRWTDNQQFEDLPDGRLKMTFATNSTVQVWPWLRSWGNDAELVRPDWPAE